MSHSLSRYLQRPRLTGSQLIAKMNDLFARVIC
jgi:hypothetical protein